MEKEKSTKGKLWAFMAGMGSATIMILAFFIPSLQDQWDRYQYRKVVDQYEQIGDEFFDEEKYDLAEQSYAKADTFSNVKRIEIEIKRLNAKVNKISINPNWDSKLPEGLEESDFLFLLHMLTGKENDKKRAEILNSYGVFLTKSHKMKEAKKTFDEALETDSLNSLIYINFGNFFDQQQKKNEAEKMYRKAIAIDNENAYAHYNLGLLLVEEGKTAEAKKEFENAIRLDSEDQDAKIQYDLLEN